MSDNNNTYVPNSNNSVSFRTAYRIKSVGHGTVLDDWAGKTGENSAALQPDDAPDSLNRTWSLIPNAHGFRIKSVGHGTVLDEWDGKTGEDSAALQPDDAPDSLNRTWSLIPNAHGFRIKSVGHGIVLDDWAGKTGENSAALQPDNAPDSTNRTWSFISVGGILLKNATKEELKEKIKPHFDDFSTSLHSSQKEKITLDQVVDGVSNALKGQSPAGTPKAHYTPVAVVEHAGDAPCSVAIGTVIADAVSLVLGLAGINEEESRAAARVILEELGQDTVRGLSATIHDLSETASFEEKAKLIWKLLSEIKNALGIEGIKKALSKTETRDFFFTRPAANPDP